MKTLAINREYKDRLFRLLFGDESNKKDIISLYNALNDTEYTEEDDFEITTLEDAIYMHMKNDVSFLIDSYLTLWEQQSTFNPNMPVRGLMYYGKVYNSYIEKRGLDIIIVLWRKYLLQDMWCFTMEMQIKMLSRNFVCQRHLYTMMQIANLNGRLPW